MRVPGCGVPPPPDSRRFNSNNSQITNNTNCNDCNNNRNTNNNNNNNNINDNVIETFGSPKSVESNDNIGYQANNWPIARGNQRGGITSGGCLEHQDSTGCLTAETARPTPLPPQRTKGRPFGKLVQTTYSPWTRSGWPTSWSTNVPRRRSSASRGVGTTLLASTGRSLEERAASRLQPVPQPTSQLLMFIPDTLRSCMVEPDVSTYLQAPSVGQVPSNTYIHNSCLFVSWSASLENLRQLLFRIPVIDRNLLCHARAFASTLAITFVLWRGQFCSSFQLFDRFRATYVERGFVLSISLVRSHFAR
ncbi:hypothetical protein WN51_13431 [Melipona quadrifasciata]|uniref:Uncharacterized protein n=1 Tax=Melipona quadrifasciata TaxID=166423 RepID=A0A0M9A0J2_9HYME|nr:hypothetical protein WN51_13431 [Melipona quadrifasciata]